MLIEVALFWEESDKDSVLKPTTLTIPNSEDAHSLAQGADIRCIPTKEWGWWGLARVPTRVVRRVSMTSGSHSPCTLAFPAPAATKWFMWSDLLLSVTSDLWTSWNEPQGEGGKVTERCLKEKLHTSTLWKAKHIIFCTSSIIFPLPGHLVGRKTVNWWQPWNKQLERLFFFFFLSAGRSCRKWGHKERSSLHFWHVEVVIAGKRQMEMLCEESCS